MRVCDGVVCMVEACCAHTLVLRGWLRDGFWIGCWESGDGGGQKNSGVWMSRRRMEGSVILKALRV